MVGRSRGRPELKFGLMGESPLPRDHALDHDLLTVQEARNSGDSDPAVLSFATAINCTVVTQNRRDFISLHRQNPEHSGLIACSVDQDSEALANRINADILAEEPLVGKLIHVVRPAQSQFTLRRRRLHDRRSYLQNLTPRIRQTQNRTKPTHRLPRQPPLRHPRPPRRHHPHRPHQPPRPWFTLSSAGPTHP
jgi:hypothetical protein